VLVKLCEARDFDLVALSSFYRFLQAPGETPTAQLRGVMAAAPKLGGAGDRRIVLHQR
jgi:hypothetical protein